MRKMKRLHIAVALLAVASIVSLLGTALVGIRASPEEWVSIFGVKPVCATVWFDEPIPPDEYPISSRTYGSWGRGKLHLLMDWWGAVGGKTMTFEVYALLWNPTKTDHHVIFVAEYTLAPPEMSKVVTLDVPGSQFYFVVFGYHGTFASLSFYLSL